MNDTTETVYQRKSSETAQHNFVVMKDILCRFAFLQEIQVWSFKGAIYIRVELEPTLFCATQMDEFLLLYV